MAIAEDDVYYVEIYPVTTTYTEKVRGGVTGYTRSETSQKGNAMSFSGTSNCNVVDLQYLTGIEGKFTFQFLMLSGTTSALPVSGTSVSVHWRGTNVDSSSAWVQATKNTIINGVNAFSGITNVGYYLNDITGVTPFRFVRIETESGVSADLGGGGNIKTVGVLYIR